MLTRGLVQVYTKKSEKYNYAPIGLSLRASGQGLRTLITCFSHHEMMDKAVQMVYRYLKPNVAIDHTAIYGIEPNKAPDKDKNLDAFKKVQEAVMSASYDIVILNGINHSIDLGIVSLNDLLELIKDKPHHVELILTGPNAADAVIEKADLVTDMEVITHYKVPTDIKSYEKEGVIEVVTGNGKGKTTYCLGKSMMTSCLGIRCMFLQFVKSPQLYGEIVAIKPFPNMEIKTMGEGFLDTDAQTQKKKHVEAAREAWEKCLREIFSLKYGLVVLDEINTAAHFGLVSQQRLHELLFLKPKNLHLILSGRYAHPEIMEAASSVIEMKEIKHPYNKGIKARKGIEF